MIYRTKPVDVKPAQVKPAEIKPVQVKPVIKVLQSTSLWEMMNKLPNQNVLKQYENDYIKSISKQPKKVSGFKKFLLGLGIAKIKSDKVSTLSEKPKTNSRGTLPKGF